MKIPCLWFFPALSLASNTNTLNGAKGRLRHANASSRKVQEVSCGNGVIGSGVCEDSNLCCSIWGDCGTGFYYCGVSDAPCGGGNVGNGVCSDPGLCCSPFGWCGTSEIHCDRVEPPCGGGQVGNGVCSDTTLCCSSDGWCGCNAGTTCDATSCSLAATLTVEDVRAGLDQMGWSVPDPSQDILDSINEVTRDYSLYMQIAFVAHTIWESGGYVSVVEGCAVDPNLSHCGGVSTAEDYQDCGAQTPSYPADGALYYGRGYIQLSNCYNYIAYGRQRFEQGHSPERFTDALQFYYDPDLVAQDSFYAVDSAAFFFEGLRSRGVINGNFGETTLAVNGCHACEAAFTDGIGVTCPPGMHQHVDTSKKRFQIFQAIAERVGLIEGSYSEEGCYELSDDNGGDTGTGGDGGVPSAPGNPCGGGVVGDGVCEDSSLCCSEWGHCGTGDAFCGSN